ncbi:hypothetical protein [Streptomyces sp. NPDC059802]|uniref:hypothetical protein n=1 Tax=Streptomyces sp. NPDC059802 TaxID=3346952 RepID=UPI003649CC59
MLLEQYEDDWTRLEEANEHVSGPAATEYRRRTASAAAFLGRTVRAQASVSSPKPTPTSTTETP